jgi:hypothetical protein
MLRLATLALRGDDWIADARRSLAKAWASIGKLRRLKSEKLFVGRGTFGRYLPGSHRER